MSTEGKTFHDTLYSSKPRPYAPALYYSPYDLKQVDTAEDYQANEYLNRHLISQVIIPVPVVQQSGAGGGKKATCIVSMTLLTCGLVRG